MAGSIAGGIRAEPNMTPLLDVVFQLITFFMLVFRISGENFDQRINLPVAGSARPVEGAQPQDRLILNIDNRGRMIWRNQPLEPEAAIKELRTQAQLARLNLKIQGKPVEEGASLPTLVVFRADRGVTAEIIYRYIAACQAQGFHRFALKAMNAES